MNPFQATLYVDEVPMIVVNGKNMFHFEHQRTRNGDVASIDSNANDDAVKEDKHGGKKIVGYWEDGEFKISFILIFIREMCALEICFYVHYL